MKNCKYLVLVSLFFFGLCACDTENKDEENEVTDIETVQFIEQAISCVDFSVNVLENNEETQRALLIYGNSKDDLVLTEASQTFNLPVENLTVSIRDYDLPIGTWFYCNDIAFDPWPQVIEEWDLVSGSITMSVSNIQSDPNLGLSDLYDLFILLEDAVFENELGEQLMVEELELEDLPMGWYPG